MDRGKGRGRGAPHQPPTNFEIFVIINAK